ncbi:MAG TPA: M12 family metallo-peptidase [Blastocatellia bacterium]|nr:M12 family metallo-peptidase [Blastocatellia bacterium]HMV84072.1 M12 family metallo-peptidase [Blastocatellia bacterium]HNG29136.1 M12 family metallo-peptidase [Blastocatellia bacterium]
MKMVRFVNGSAKTLRYALGGLALLILAGAVLGLNSTSLAARMQRMLAAQSQPQSKVRFPVGQSAGTEIWRERKQAGKPSSFRLNADALAKALSGAPMEGAGALADSPAIVSLPMPDGNPARFQMQESPILDAALRKQFPEIKSYRGRGIDDPSATMRCDWSPRGFHALVLGAEGAFTVLPSGDADFEYLAAAANDLPEKWSCNVNESKVLKAGLHDPKRPAAGVGDTLRTYRIAVAATGEYTMDANLGGGSVAGAIASINTWLNGVNAIYERELSVRLMLVSNALETPVIFTDAGSDPFSNGNTTAMVNQARATLRDSVGSANYDLGHVLGTGGGGDGLVGVVCNNGDFNGDGFGPAKGGGATLMNGPVGNATFIGGLAHEIGHQFGATHTHNAGSIICGSLRSSTSAYESGGGLTIMGYAGLCVPDNISNARELRFHNGSFQQIISYINSSASCATTAPTGNTAPTVNGGNDYLIPKNTPFVLTAAGSDADSGDAAGLLYNWEELDAGGPLYANPPYTDSGDFPFSTRPIFRPFSPSALPTRIFPSLTYILNNANNPPDVVGGLQTAEELPQVQRQMNFRVTVRDGRGGVTDDAVIIDVDSTTGPFAVTAPNIALTWQGGAQQMVTWSVNGTNGAPINCANVKITLSTDGGQTFPITLIGSTPNDGSETVTVPIGLFSATARVKVESVGNVFFDISDANFTVSPSGSDLGVSGISPKVGNVGHSVVISGANFTGVNAVKFAGGVNATFAVNGDNQITATVPAGAVSGPITLSKSGSPDVQTESYTVCAAPPATLAVDDGSYENAFRFGATGGTTYYVARLTPASYPATLNQVMIHFNSLNSLSAGTPITVVAGTNADGNTNINFTNFQTINTTIGTLNQFNSYAVQPLTIAGGDFVVGFGIAFSTVTFPGLVDTSSPDVNRSYVSTDGANFSPVAELNLGVNGDLAIRAQVFTGNCSGSGCAYSLMPTAQNFPAAGGNNTVNVIADAGCPWTAVSNAAWINVTSGASGTGNGTVAYTVAVNAGPQRNGTITIAGQTFTVTQGSGCTFSLAPQMQNFIAAGGNGSLTVTTAAICGWTATTNDAWINIISGSGTGNGTATFSVTANTGPQRSGSILVGDQTFTVTQDSGCTFSIAPTSQNFSASGGSSSVGVTTAAGCSWTAVSNDSWLTVTGGATGTGNGVVGYSVAANTGNARTGTITIAGQTFTVNQDCTGFSITAHPNSTVACAGQPASFFVTASGQGPFSYQWRKNNVNIQDAVNSTYSIGITAPGDAGTYDVVVTGSCGAVPSNPATLTINVAPNVTLSPANQSAIVGGSATFTAAATGTPTPTVQWQVSVNGGVNYNDISGATNPTLTLNNLTLAQHNTRYRAVFTNSCSVVESAAAILTVTCPTISATPATLNAGIVGTPYNQQLAGNGGASPYSFALSGGSLPTNVTLSSGGLLSGTPTVMGTFNFAVQITDANTCSSTQNFSLTINPPCGTITVNPATLANGFVGTAYNQTLTGSGGATPYTFAVSSGSLPGGLIVSSGGALTGTPTAAGTFTFTVRATDVNTCTGTRSYTVIISGNGLQFYPLPQPVRLLETRAGLTACTTPGAAINAGGTLTLPARTTCAGIPAGAQAVTGNITVVPSGGGFLTLFPSSAQQPTVANSNFGPGEVTNNVFTIGLGAGDGAFKIFASATTHVIVDVTGYYAPPAAGGLYFHPLATPVRLLETRAGLNGCIAPGASLIGTGDPNADPNLDFAVQGRSPVASPCNSIPTSAQMLVGNATSVVPSNGGFLTIYPSGGTRPLIASSNYSGNDVINGPFAVKLGADGKFKIYTLRTTHLVIDILGYYSEEAVDANGAGLLFSPLAVPVRLLETRPDFPNFPLPGCTRTNAPIQGNLNAATHTQQAAGFCGLPATAQSVVGNASVVSTPGAGFLTLFPGNLTTAPLVATSNYPTPAAAGYNRHYFVGLSPTNGTFKVLTQFTTDLILDASGYFAP